jgi:hypothetical protein
MSNPAGTDWTANPWATKENRLSIAFPIVGGFTIQVTVCFEILISCFLGSEVVCFRQWANQPHLSTRHHWGWGYAERLVHRSDG